MGTDLCSRNNKEYLIAVDYYSRWIEVIPFKSTSSEAVINKLRKIFATHGVPETIISDNGPQFKFQEFESFAREYDFIHITSSPHFQQANGQAESAVKVAKKMLKQPSLDMALLNYRSTVHSATGVSPAAALMGQSCHLSQST